MINLKGNWASSCGCRLEIHRHLDPTFGGTLVMSNEEVWEFNGIHDSIGNFGMVANQVSNPSSPPLGIRGQLINGNGVPRLELDLESKAHQLQQSILFYEEHLIPTTLLEQ